MDNIEIEDVQDINNMALYNEKEITVKSKSNIFYLVEYFIEQTIHDIGLDKEISRFSGNSDKYKEVLVNYERKYKAGNIRKDQSIIRSAYEYIEHVLGLSYVLYDDSKIVTYEGNANGLEVFCALYEKYRDLCSQYEYVNGFIENYNKKLDNAALKRM